MSSFSSTNWFKTNLWERALNLKDPFPDSSVKLNKHRPKTGPLHGPAPLLVRGKTTRRGLSRFKLNHVQQPNWTKPKHLSTHPGAWWSRLKQLLSFYLILNNFWLFVKNIFHNKTSLNSLSCSSPPYHHAKVKEFNMNRCFFLTSPAPPS